MATFRTEGGEWVTRVNYNVADIVCKDGPVDEVIASFKDAVEVVPEEYRASARLEIDATIEYDSPSLDIALTYERPATGEEIAESRRVGAERLAARKAMALRELRHIEEQERDPVL